jgi:hypothetical protein
MRYSQMNSKENAFPHYIKSLWMDIQQLSNLTQMKSNQAALSDQTSPMSECLLYFAGSQWQLTF